jgi:hypothetical protein
MKAVEDESVGLSIYTAIGQGSVFKARTGALCRFDVCKRHTFRGHRGPIDSSLMVGNVDALRKRCTLWQRARNHTSRECDEVGEKSHVILRGGDSLLKQRKPVQAKTS